MMDRDGVKKRLQGPYATVPTPFDDKFEVDYGRMYEITQWWVEMGLVNGKSVIKVAAAMGEGPQLRDSEWPHLLEITVQAAKGRVAVMGGISYKDTVRTIEDAKRARDLGVTALQVTTPALNGPTEDDNLRYFEDLSNAVDIGVMIYNTHGMAGGAISVDGFRKMVDFENIVAIKWSPPPPERPIPGKYEEIFELADRFNIIDNCFGPVRCHKLGGRGYINHNVDIYPPHDLRVWELAENGQYDEADELYKSVEGRLGEWAAGRPDMNRSGGQARLKKAMMAVMGNPVGVSRPPSLPLTDDDMESLKELMVSFGWPVPQAVAV